MSDIESEDVSSGSRGVNKYGAKIVKVALEALQEVRDLPAGTHLDYAKFVAADAIGTIREMLLRIVSGERE